MKTLSTSVSGIRNVYMTAESVIQLACAEYIMSVFQCAVIFSVHSIATVVIAVVVLLLDAVIRSVKML